MSYAKNLVPEGIVKDRSSLIKVVSFSRLIINQY